jgi:acetolactate synthase-1/2/3 large subunit
MAQPVAKAFHTVKGTDSLEDVFRAAHAQAISGEPGPVIVELTREAITGYADSTAAEPSITAAGNDDWEVIATRLSESRRPVFMIGQGAVGAVEPLRRLVEALQCPVFSNGSGRGILPDNHPLNVGTSVGQATPGEPIEVILADTDLVIALGCKLTHNGTYGFRLALPTEKLVRVDTSAEVLAAGYPASVSVVGDVAAVVERLLEATRGEGPKDWDAERLEELRSLAVAERHAFADHDSALVTPHGESPDTLFAKLRVALPDDARVVTDSGLHQFLVRRHFEVRTARTLLTPADFQSMGYGIPAAIGAQVATPDRTTVAVVGDGGFAMTGLEMATAIRERIPIKVLVVSNEALELIRESQIDKRGTEHAVRVLSPDLAVFAASLGVRFAQWHDLSGAALKELLASPEPALIEVQLTGSRPGVAARLKGRIRGMLEPHLTAGISSYVRQRRRG